MATRLSPPAGGLPSGTLFAAPSAFTGGVAGTMATTLGDVALAASGSVTQYWVENFDITVNIAPIYVDSWYQGYIGTMPVTLGDVVMQASEASAYTGTMHPTLGPFVLSTSGSSGLPAFGPMNIVLGEFSMNFTGAHVAPINGTMITTLGDFLMVAGLEFLGKKTSQVVLAEKKTSNVYVR